MFLETLLLGDNVVLDNKNFALRNTVCCATPNVIYAAICIHCLEFYIGHTDQSFRERVTGHRSSFNSGNENSSALAYHIKNCHPDSLMNKLHNFMLCILEDVGCPSRLDRREQFFIDSTRAKIIGLNRHDAIRRSLL